MAGRMAMGRDGEAAGMATGMARIAWCAALAACLALAAPLCGCQTERQIAADQAKEASEVSDGDLRSWHIVRIDGRWYDAEVCEYGDSLSSLDQFVLTNMRCEDGTVRMRRTKVYDVEFVFDAEGDDDAWARYDTANEMLELHLPKSATE